MGFMIVIHNHVSDFQNHERNDSKNRKAKQLLYCDTCTYMIWISLMSLHTLQENYFVVNINSQEIMNEMETLDTSSPEYKFQP